MQTLRCVDVYSFLYQHQELTGRQDQLGSTHFTLSLTYEQRVHQAYNIHAFLWWLLNKQVCITTSSILRKQHGRSIKNFPLLFVKAFLIVFELMGCFLTKAMVISEKRGKKANRTELFIHYYVRSRYVVLGQWQHEMANACTPISAVVDSQQPRIWNKIRLSFEFSPPQRRCVLSK